MTSKVSLPTVDQLLEAGVQFGHETKRWHPLMEKYLFGSKEGIHIFNIEETLIQLEKAVEAVKDLAGNGPILFVGTKRQASSIVRDEAVRVGAYFIDQRWPGGMLTNFGVVKNSLNKLNSLESQFEKGVTNRTKFEVSQMKKEWARLFRLYSGMKQLKSKPAALVVVDANYEIGAIKEARKLGIPVIAIVDSNTRPNLVDHVIPANDDAIKSIELIVHTLADAVYTNNEKHRITHHLKDYGSADIEISKAEEQDEEKEVKSEPTKRRAPKKVKKKKVVKKKSSGNGILENVQKEKKAKKAKNAKAKKATKKESK